MAKTITETISTENVSTPEELEALLKQKEKELAKREKALAEKEKALKYSQDTSISAKQEKPDKDLHRKVKVRLPLGADKEPVTVRVNDRLFIIKRGVDVEVPYYVGLSLQESMDADDAVRMRLSGMDEQFSTESEKL